MAFFGENRHRFGVEPICEVLWIALSAYSRHATRRRGPSLQSDRAIRDEALKAENERVWQANFRVYGADAI